MTARVDEESIIHKLAPSVYMNGRWGKRTRAEERRGEANTGKPEEHHVMRKRGRRWWAASRCFHGGLNYADVNHTSTQSQICFRAPSRGIQPRSCVRNGEDSKKKKVVWQFIPSSSTPGMLFMSPCLSPFICISSLDERSISALMHCLYCAPYIISLHAFQCVRRGESNVIQETL